MKYIDKTSRDLELRLNYELNNHKNANFIALEIDKDSIEYLKMLLLVRSISENLKNITSFALKRYFERYRKKYKTYPKHCFIATHSQTEKSIYIHGVIFTPNSQKLKDSWSFGSIHIKPIETPDYFTNFFVNKYNQSKHNKINLYTSKHFGVEAQQNETAKIIKTKIIDLLPNESFKPIPFSNGYYISKNSVVISKKRKNTKILKTRTYNKNTYVTLFKNSKPKTYKLAYLMALTYLNLSRNSYYKILHLNDKKSDNRLTNLKLKKVA
jgi:hypothetical protein